MFIQSLQSPLVHVTCQSAVCLPQRRGGQRNVACVLFLSAPAAVAVQTSAGALPVCVLVCGFGALTLDAGRTALVFLFLMLCRTLFSLNWPLQDNDLLLHGQCK